MLKTYTASESLSWERTKNVPRMDCSLDGDSRCLDASSNFSYINFCNIHGLDLIFNLWCTTSPPLNLIFSSPIPSYLKLHTVIPTVSSYFLYSHFQSKSGCCVYVRNDITCSHAHALESTEFFTNSLRLYCHSTTKFFCVVYRSSNFSDYVKLF